MAILPKGNCNIPNIVKLSDLHVDEVNVNINNGHKVSYKMAKILSCLEKLCQLYMIIVV